MPFPKLESSTSDGNNNIGDGNKFGASLGERNLYVRETDFQ